MERHAGVLSSSSILKKDGRISQNREVLMIKSYEGIPLGGDAKSKDPVRGDVDPVTVETVGDLVSVRRAVLNLGMANAIAGGRDGLLEFVSSLNPEQRQVIFGSTEVSKL